MKKVLLVVIDALATRVVEPALTEARLPLLAELARRGEFRSQCISIFPSITPAATASIVTGCYPAQHCISGAFWYDPQQDSVAYYGDDVWVLMNEGIGSYFRDFLIALNYERLCADTLYERVERAWKSSAVVNYMWFRGDTPHDVDAPLLLQLLPGVDFEASIKGPRVMLLGDFVSSPPPGGGDALRARGGVSRRFGFHDETTGDYLRALFKTGDIPDFTLAYFPNNDYQSHDTGPHNAVSVLEAVDVTLGTLADEYGGIDRFLNDVAIVITGDHSQTDQCEDPQQRGINLDELLSEFHLVPAGQNWGPGDDLLICPNMRAVQIYLCKERADALLPRVTEHLLRDQRVDQVMWAGNVDPAGKRQFEVSTHRRGRLCFSRANRATPGSVRDRYGNQWSCRGELSAVGATIDDHGTLEYTDYPNALERIEGAFSEVSGELWATAMPHFEFCMPQTTVHPGGSHGSLHRDDSTAPLFAAGIPTGIVVPDHPRTIDLASLCLTVLGIES